ncbi:MAG: hypothetical protein ACRC8Y_19375 [Chroococcales cyanobacterium]
MSQSLASPFPPYKYQEGPPYFYGEMMDVKYGCSKTPEPLSYSRLEKSAFLWVEEMKLGIEPRL